MNARISRARVPAAAAALLLAGCTQDFTPGSVLDDLRVIALAPSPAEVGPGEAVTIKATVHVPDPAAAPVVEEAWTFCPLTTGPGTAYACVDPRCELPLAGATALDANGFATATANPTDLGRECLARLGGALPSEPGGTLPSTIETVFRYRVRTEPPGRPELAEERIAVARVPLRDAIPAPADRNVAPSFLSIAIGDEDVWRPPDGAPVTAARPASRAARLPVVVKVDPATIQRYVEAGRTLTEGVVVEVYSTAGRFDEDRGSPPTASFSLDLSAVPAGVAAATVYVVARDLRGGQLAAGPYTVPLAP